QIQLSAPQYPEGLVLKIHANKLAGNVDIINGLNHYIGMKSLHTNDFFEFTILPYIIGFFGIAFLITAIVGSRRLLNIMFFLFVCFGIVAMIDFWKWDYNYGHNLNPDAAIIVPGMAYQPPLIGYKQLLNFGAYSIPDIGGWLFISAGVILLALVIVTFRNHKKFKTKNAAALLLPILMMFSLSSCNKAPQPITVGVDKCDFCKMPVSDARFGAEILTNKGKAYKFDDEHCLRSFLQQPSFSKEKSYTVYFVDFSGNHSLIPASTSFFLKSSALRSPMNGNVAAFSNKDSLQKVNDKYPGTVLQWDQLLQP
ncbi:MAG: nitrous oxide reductase accessory protein NosL, partial [Parafilimonas sp.]